MPQHITQDLFNSHFEFLKDSEKQAAQEKFYLQYADWEEYYYSPVMWVRNFAPIGLIVKQNNRFSFQSQMEKQVGTLEGRSEVKYFVVFLEDSRNNLDDISKSNTRLGLIRLGKLGFHVDHSKVVNLKHEYDSTSEMTTRCNFMYHVISDSPDEIKILAMALGKTWELIFKLNENNVEESIVIVREHPLGIFLNSHCKSYFDKFQTISIGERRLISGSFDAPNKNYYSMLLDENTLKTEFETLYPVYAPKSTAISCVMGNTNFILHLKKEGIDVYKMTFTEKLDGEIEHLWEPVKFTIKNWNDIQFDHPKTKICQLTDSKYLMLVYEKSFQLGSIQEYFLFGFKWFLVDLKNCLIKMVYPRVYDLGDPIKDLEGFQSVPKKLKRGRKKLKSHEGFYDDGDLNGGYSDSSLLSYLKNNESQETPTSLEPFDKSGSFYHVSRTVFRSNIYSFRPFIHSPDLFQICFTIPHTMRKHNFKPASRKTNAENWNANPQYHGKMFKFYFRFRDEFTKIVNNTVKFSDVIFNFD